MKFFICGCNGMAGHTITATNKKLHIYYSLILKFLITHYDSHEPLL